MQTIRKYDFTANYTKALVENYLFGPPYVAKLFIYLIHDKFAT